MSPQKPVAMAKCHYKDIKHNKNHTRKYLNKSLLTVGRVFLVKLNDDCNSFMRNS